MTVLSQIANGSSGKDARDTLNAMLSTVVALVDKTAAISVVQLGDSIGAGAASGGSPPAFNIMGFPGTTVLSNLAVSGETMQTELTRVQNGAADGAYSTSVPSLAVIQSGTNDLFNQTTPVTASALYNNTVIPLITLLKSKGFYVALMTVLPRKLGAFAGTAAQEQERITYNNLVRANSAGADYVRDVTLNSDMGDASGAINDTSRYLDGLHPTAYGQTLLKPEFQATVRNFLLSAVRLQGLKALTLSGQIIIGTASTGTINNATAGSSIVSNMPGLTVNSAARTYAWDGSGSASTVANGLVETLSGNINSPRSSSISSTAAPTANYVQLTSRSNMAESVNSGGGYNYVASGGPGTYGQSYGYAAKAIPAGADGFLTAVRTGAPASSGPIFGLSANAAPTTLTSASNGSPLIVADGTGSYSVIFNGANPAVANNIPIAANDVFRARRTGSTLAVEISKDTGSTWTLLYSTTAPTGALTPVMFGGVLSASGSLNQLVGSANIA